FRPEVTEFQRDNVKARFLDLQNKCLRDGKPYIREIVGGEPNGGEGAERGFEQGYVVRFASQGDRNYYVGTPTIADPAHDAFKAFVGPLLEPGPGGVLVFDFDAGHA
ncbi:MAG: Dabb family protein, partial [Actinomycetospora chiangmaiensis]|nr:Dabb family protein [Actinomycetospora chiangmaiensis]